MNSRFLKLSLIDYNFAEKVESNQISLELIFWGPHSSLEREKKFSRCSRTQIPCPSLHINQAFLLIITIIIIFFKYQSVSLTALEVKCA